MPQVGFERAKTVHALDRAATVVVLQSDGDLHLCSELCYSLTGRDGGGSVNLYIISGGHGITKFESLSGSNVSDSNLGTRWFQV
jgi:hypothetical protein